MIDELILTLWVLLMLAAVIGLLAMVSRANQGFEADEHEDGSA